MENISEFIPVIWGVIIFGVMIYRALSQKPRPVETSEEMEGGEELQGEDHREWQETLQQQSSEAGQQRSQKSRQKQEQRQELEQKQKQHTVLPYDPYKPRTVEEILEQLVERSQPKGEASKREVVPTPKPKRAEPVTSRAKKGVEKPLRGELAKSEIMDKIALSEGENFADECFDFDLRQAVIMSEILTRKYDE
ncbi:MAG: hypothetical protein R3Y08_03415 [Rikenellaceae bacterium]